MQNNIFSFSGHQEQHCFKSISLVKGHTGTIIKAARDFEVFSVLEKQEVNEGIELRGREKQVIKKKTLQLYVKILEQDFS